MTPTRNARGARVRGLAGGLGAGFVAIAAALLGGCRGEDGPPPAAPAALILDESFELPGLPAGWVASPGGQWETGPADPLVGPGRAFDGKSLAGTDLDDLYLPSTRSSLDTPPLDLRGVVEPILAFHHFFDTEIDFDGANLKISTDGGTFFSRIDPGTVDPPYTGELVGSSAVRFEQCWSGQSAGFERVVVDLEANLPAGLPRERVVIRFDFGSDGSVQGPGWYLDQVRVGARAGVPLLPRITSQPILDATVGQPYAYAIVADGNPEPTVSATGLPPSGSLVLVAGTRTIAGTPLTADIGTHAVTVRATNSAGTTTQPFTLTVRP